MRTVIILLHLILVSISLSSQAKLPDDVCMIESFNHVNESTSKIELLAYCQNNSGALIIVDDTKLYKVTDDPAETRFISEEDGVIEQVTVYNGEDDRGTYFFSIQDSGDSKTAILKYIDENFVVTEVAVVENTRRSTEVVLLVPNSTVIYFTVQLEERAQFSGDLYTLDRANPASLQKLDIGVEKTAKGGSLVPPLLDWDTNGFYYLRTESTGMSFEFFDHQAQESILIYDYSTERVSEMFCFGQECLIADVENGRIEILSVDLNSRMTTSLDFIEGAFSYSEINEVVDFEQYLFFTIASSQVESNLWVYDKQSSEINVVENALPGGRNLRIFKDHLFWISGNFDDVFGFSISYMDPMTKQISNVSDTEGAFNFGYLDDLIPFGDRLYVISSSTIDYIEDIGGSLLPIGRTSFKKTEVINNKLYNVDNQELIEISIDGSIITIGGNILPVFSLENVYVHQDIGPDDRELVVYDRVQDSTFLFVNFNEEYRPSKVVWQSAENTTISVFESKQYGYEPFHFNHEDETLSLIGDFDLSEFHLFNFTDYDNSILINLELESGDPYVGSFNTNTGLSNLLDEEQLMGERPNILAIYQDDLYYSISDRPWLPHGLWKYNPTEGHVFLKDGESWVGNSIDKNPIFIDNKLWLRTNQNVYSTDGTPEGTILEFEADSDPNTNFACLGNAYEAAGRMLFTQPGGFENDIWTYDSALGKTVLLQDLDMVNGVECIFNAFVVGENLVFSTGSSFGEEPELYSIKADGNLDFITINPKLDNFGNNHTILDDELYFNASTFLKTDGTADGTSTIFPNEVTDIRSNNDFVFFVNEGMIFSYDPKNEAMSQLFEEDLFFDSQDLHLNDSSLFFQARLSENGPFRLFKYELFSSNNVEAIVYHDEDNDRVYEDGEQGIQGVPVTINSRTFYTGSNGSFSFSSEDITALDLSVGDVNCWTHDGSNVVINQEADGRWSIHIGLVKSDAVGSVDGSLSIGIPRCGFTVPLWIDVTNNTCVPFTGKVGLVLDPLLSLESVISEESDIDNDTIWWDLVQTESQSSNHLVYVTVANENFNGDSFVVKSFIKDDLNGITIESETLQDSIRCAIDPNDKLVNPSREDPENSNYTLKDELLFYTVRFQNTGTDTAFTVVIKDQLSSKLDWSTLMPLSWSHDVITELSETGEITFTFNNILLPDDKINEPGSHGYVRYQIKSKANITDFDLIDNNAGIFFDFNEPIITNTVTNTLVETLDFDEDNSPFWQDCNDNDSSISPNSEEVANNNIDENCDGEILIIDADMDGFNSDEDCVDTDSTINPDAEEIANNDIDEDCDGEDLISTAVNELSILKVSFYPNPVHSHFYVDIQNNIRYQLSIYNTIGVKVLSSLNNNNIDVSDLSQGTYYVEIKDLDSSHFNLFKIAIIR